MLLFTYLFIYLFIDENKKGLFLFILNIYYNKDISYLKI